MLEKEHAQKLHNRTRSELQTARMTPTRTEEIKDGILSLWTELIQGKPLTSMHMLKISYFTQFYFFVSSQTPLLTLLAEQK